MERDTHSSSTTDSHLIATSCAPYWVTTDELLARAKAAIHRGESSLRAATEFMAQAQLRGKASAPASTRPEAPCVTKLTTKIKEYEL